MEISECPLCGAAAKPSDKKCNYCKSEFFVTSIAYLGNVDSGSFNKYLKYYKELISKEPQNSEGLLGLGLCFLQMGTYPLAQKYFEQLIEYSPEVSQSYYYFTLSFIRGRRLMCISLKDAKLIETYINTAIQLDDSHPQYKLLLAMLKRDYFEMNGLKIQPPSVSEILNDIQGKEMSKKEMDHLLNAIKVGDPQFFLTKLVLK